MLEPSNAHKWFSSFAEIAAETPRTWFKNTSEFLISRSSTVPLSDVLHKVKSDFLAFHGVASSGISIKKVQNYIERRYS